MSGLGYAISIFSLVMFAIPIASISIILAAIQFLHLDRKYRRKAAMPR
jgi:uncharacterized membrane protein